MKNFLEISQRLQNAKVIPQFEECINLNIQSAVSTNSLVASLTINGIEESTKILIDWGDGEQQTIEPRNNPITSTSLPSALLEYSDNGYVVRHVYSAENGLTIFNKEIILVSTTTEGGFQLDRFPITIKPIGIIEYGDIYFRQESNCDIEDSMAQWRINQSVNKTLNNVWIDSEDKGSWELNTSHKDNIYHRLEGSSLYLTVEAIGKNDTGLIGNNLYCIEKDLLIDEAFNLGDTIVYKEFIDKDEFVYDIGSDSGCGGSILVSKKTRFFRPLPNEGPVLTNE